MSFIVTLLSCIYLITAIIEPDKTIEITAHFLDFTIMMKQGKRREEDPDHSSLFTHIFNCVLLFARFIVLFTLLGVTSVYEKVLIMKQGYVTEGKIKSKTSNISTRTSTSTNNSRPSKTTANMQGITAQDNKSAKSTLIEKKKGPIEALQKNDIVSVGDNKQDTVQQKQSFLADSIQDNDKPTFTVSVNNPSFITKSPSIQPIIQQQPITQPDKIVPIVDSNETLASVVPVDFNEQSLIAPVSIVPKEKVSTPKQEVSITDKEEDYTLKQENHTLKQEDHTLKQEDHTLKQEDHIPKEAPILKEAPIFKEVPIPNPIPEEEVSILKQEAHIPKETPIPKEEEYNSTTDWFVSHEETKTPPLSPPTTTHSSTTQSHHEEGTISSSTTTTLSRKSSTATTKSDRSSVLRNSFQKALQKVGKSNSKQQQKPEMETPLVTPSAAAVQQPLLPPVQPKPSKSSSSNRFSSIRLTLRKKSNRNSIINDSSVLLPPPSPPAAAVEPTPTESSRFLKLKKSGKRLSRILS